MKYLFYPVGMTVGNTQNTFVSCNL